MKRGQRRHVRAQARAHVVVEAAHQREFGHVDQRPVGGEVRRIQREIVGVFGPVARLRLAVRVDPVGERVGEFGGQAQDRQQAAEMRELRDVDLSLASPDC